MIIEKNIDHLNVWSNIYFDESYCFCGRPYVYLIAYKDKPKYGWGNNMIGIAVHDNDDFDIGLIYETDSENFENVLHELMNWMRDHEQGISCYRYLWDTLKFFPDCGCKRNRW